jgi:hypothetical protein
MTSQTGHPRRRLAEGKIGMDPIVLVATQVRRYDPELFVDQKHHRRMIFR